MDNLQNNKTNKLLTFALIDLMKEKNFNDIKVNEICSRALVHKTTFYNHFEDKYDLLNFVIKELNQSLKDKADNAHGIIEYYLSIAKLYIKTIKENQKLYSSIINSNSNEISYYIFYESYVNDVELNISKNNIPIPSNYVAKFYVSAFFSIINEWFIKGMKEDEDTLMKYIEILVKSEKQI